MKVSNESDLFQRAILYLARKAQATNEDRIFVEEATDLVDRWLRERNEAAELCTSFAEWLETKKGEFSPDCTMLHAFECYYETRAPWVNH